VNLTTADLQTVFAVAALTFVRLADDLREWDGGVADFTGRDWGAMSVPPAGVPAAPGAGEDRFLQIGIEVWQAARKVRR
jgi:hypothetical protein